MIQVDGPEIKILLLKNTGVDFSSGGLPYRGANSTFDEVGLTGFLGDAGHVFTDKCVHEPCGAFEIKFGDKKSNTGADTVYALVEPQDMVEIRMSRIPTGVGGTPPLIMRGFVSKIDRDEEIGADGQPHRTVTVSGHDSGKLWQIHSILPEAQLLGDLVSMIAEYRLQATTGILFGLMTLAEFVTRFTENIMNHAVNQMSAFAGRALPTFNPVVTVPPEEGMIAASVLSAFPGGRYWDVMEYVADRPWNELWVRDNPDGGNPDLILRPVPYFDLGEGLIMPGAEDPGTIQWDIGEIVRLHTSRDDARTANFFWVPPGSSIPDSNIMASVAAFTRLGGGGDGPMSSINHVNSALALYGLRKMSHETRLMSPELPAPRSANLNPPGERIAAGEATCLWHIHRAEQLKLLNMDNVVWENLMATVKGHESLVPGVYFEWLRGQRRGTGLRSKAYITRVQHDWVPLASGDRAAWLTRLGMERGFGFIWRDEVAASPYDLEGKRGPYDPSA